MKLTNTPSTEDLLTEDTPVFAQNYFVLSYLLPSSKNKNSNPMFKMRGAYKTVEEAQERIKTLQMSDKYFNLYICEVGKWGLLLPDESPLLENMSVEYMNSEMNNMMREYKNNMDKKDIEFEERKEKMMKGLYEEEPDTPENIRNRAKYIADQIELTKNKLKDLFDVKEKSDKEMESIAHLPEEAGTSSQQH